MKRAIKFTTSLFLLLIVFAVGYYIGVLAGKPKDFDWIVISIDSAGKGYGFTTEALFNSDIALPDIISISGQSKFLPTIKSQKNELHLGYMISVEVEKLNLDKMPQKYKEERKEKYKAGEFTFMPIEQVVYKVAFEFTLKDKDGFELTKLEGHKHSLYSGRTNRFQDKVQNSVSETVAERTAEIVLHMSVEECETCK